MTQDQIEALAELERRRFINSIQIKFLTRASDVDADSAKEQLGMGLKIALLAVQEVEDQGNASWDIDLMTRIYGGQ